MNKVLTTILTIIIIAILAVAGYYFYPKHLIPKVEAPEGVTYTNTEFGFTLNIPSSWKDYSVETKTWQGKLIDGNTQYSGVELVIKNPEFATKNNFQGIPIMIITPDVWKLIAEEKVAVSAAPIGPAKIGENDKYFFATPPRFIGFADDLNQQQSAEIYAIIKTFKTIK
jgi:hypothetical protein